MAEASLGRYTFAVEISANKPEIAQEVENVFKVKVQKVQTAVVKAKTKRSLRTRKIVRASPWKKAVVQLSAGQKIDLFEVAEGQAHA